MQWWCAARAVPWDWQWQAYPGVWAFVALLAAGAWYAGGRAAPGRQRAWLLLGLVTLWAGLDWPLGPLGAGYLASIHVVQFLLIGLVAPAFLLLGLPATQRLPAWFADLTHPVAAFLVFTVVMTVTHWPAVSDALMAAQLGAFVIDTAWLAAGLVFWWPVIHPYPARPRFGPLPRIIYLALNGILLHPPAAIMLFSEHPVYATYELAPPIPGINVVDDQQLAGGIMKAGTAWIMAIGIAAVIVAWHRRRRRPAHPRVTAGTT